MLSEECLRELRGSWLPNITDDGLDRLIDLLEHDSPLLIHGSFSRATPMGCLATHVAWHHPCTSRFHDDAGIQWLSGIAGLNPATSEVIRAWDGRRPWEVRSDMIAILLQERQRRLEARSPALPSCHAPGQAESDDRSLLQSHTALG
jgi:hypothetical protein